MKINCIIQSQYLMSPVALYILLNNVKENHRYSVMTYDDFSPLPLLFYASFTTLTPLVLDEPIFCIANFFLAKRRESAAYMILTPSL